MQLHLEVLSAYVNGGIGYVCLFGSGYGYFANACAAKIWLVVKPHCLSKPNHCFQ